jgi:RNA polymerase sigma-70 factor (ECF subfamily)
VKSAPALRRSLRLVSADEGAAPLSLDDVYRQYCRYVAAVILRISGRRSELEDLIQEVFAEAASGLGTLRQPEALRGWLATIAVRVARRRLRRHRFYRFIGLGTAAEYDRIADEAASPFDRALVRAVYRALEEVSVDDRVAFVLHHVEGETLDSVAALCGCSRTTAKRRVFRARSELLRRLSDD